MIIVSMESMRGDIPGRSGCDCPQQPGSITFDERRLDIQPGELIKMKEHPSPNPVRVLAVLHGEDYTSAIVEWA